jgi:hypothetical protein
MSLIKMAGTSNRGILPPKSARTFAFLAGLTIGPTAAYRTKALAYWYAGYRGQASDPRLPSPVPSAAVPPALVRPDGLANC